MRNQERIWDDLYELKLTWHYETNFDGNVKGKKVLEIGVGTGKTLRALIKKSPAKIVAIDTSVRAVNESKILKSLNVGILRADVLDMPFKDGEFDVVVCNYILNNLLEKDRKKAVKEIKRVLAKKGMVYFEDFGEGDLRSEKGRKLERNTFEKSNGLICHFFKPDEVKGLFKGFSKVEIKTKTFKPFRTLNETRMIISATIIK